MCFHTVIETLWENEKLKWELEPTGQVFLNKLGAKTIRLKNVFRMGQNDSVNKSVEMISVGSKSYSVNFLNLQ